MHWNGYREIFATQKFVDELLSDPEDVYKRQDIASFHLINPRKTTYWAVNFEENPAVLKGSDQCECMFVSSRASSKDVYKRQDGKHG